MRFEEQRDTPLCRQKPVQISPSPDVIEGYHVLDTAVSKKTFQMSIGGLPVIYWHQGQNGELRPCRRLFGSHSVVLITMLTFNSDCDLRIYYVAGTEHTECTLILLVTL